MSDSFMTPWTVAHLASSVHVVFQTRILEWVAIPGDLPDPGVKSASPALAGRFFNTEPPGKLPWRFCCCCCCCCYCSVTELCPTLCDPMVCSTPGFLVLHYLPEFAQIHVHYVCDAIQPFHLLSPLSPPALNLSQHGCLFPMSWLFHIRWPKCWSFSFSINPSSEYSGLVSFQIDWFDLLVVQGSLMSLLQHHSLKASILQCSAFILVLLSHPYMTTVQTIALTRWKSVSKVLSLLFQYTKFVIAFLLRSKRLLTAWLQSASSVILEPKKIKSVTVSTLFLLIDYMSPEVS